VDGAGSLAQEIEAKNLPMGDAELAASLEGLRVTALAVFERGAIGEADEARGELEARVAAMGQRLTRENEREGRAKCAAIIEVRLADEQPTVEDPKSQPPKHKSRTLHKKL
jgi:hypothetical protein